MLQPFVIARYGVYLAVAIAAFSVLLAHNAGRPIDLALMRGLFIFLLFTVLAFGAEATIATAPRRAQQHQLEPAPAPGHEADGDAPSAIEDDAE